MLLLYFCLLMRLIRNAQTTADLPEAPHYDGNRGWIDLSDTVNAGMVTSFGKSAGVPWPL